MMPPSSRFEIEGWREAARATLAPWPYPKTMISRGLKPHFFMRVLVITSSAMSLVEVLKEAPSASIVPVEVSRIKSSPQWVPVSGNGIGIGAWSVKVSVDGKLRARGKEEKFADVSPRPGRKMTMLEMLTRSGEDRCRTGLREDGRSVGREVGMVSLQMKIHERQGEKK